MFVLDGKDFEFSDANTGHELGIVAVGDELSVKRLKNAYKHGIFPWYNEGEPVLWWSPDPRMVLFPKEIRVSKSMKKVLRDDIFQFSLNQNFEAVIQSCAKITRKGQKGTWISPEMIAAYTELHAAGWAFSVEVWQQKELVGGLYGVRFGRIASGESMFSNMSNASKAGLIWLVDKWKNEVELIDCQEYTEHLASMGAREISRSAFLDHLKANNKKHGFAL